MSTVLSVNELRSAFTAIEEHLEEIEAHLLDQIKEGARSGDHMAWVQHCAKQVEMLNKNIKVLKSIEEHSSDVLINTLGFTADTDDLSDAGLRTFIIEVTQGMLNQHLLTLTDARRNGRVVMGEEFNIRLADGTEFTTHLTEPGNKLRERGHIRRFYEQSQLKDGDKIIFKEVSKKSWLLIAGNSPEGQTLIEGVMAKVHGFEPGELEEMIAKKQREDAQKEAGHED